MEGTILGNGVCGPVEIVGGCARKIIKLDQKDMDHATELWNYRCIKWPPPRNCDISHPDYFVSDQPFIQGINPWREIYLLNKCKMLKIPGIVDLSYHDVDVRDQELRIYTKIAGYHTLKDKLKELSQEEIDEIIHKIEKTVEKLRDNGIMHMDLKPKNIVLDEDNEPTIIDFGWGMSRDFPMSKKEKEYFDDHWEKNWDIFILKKYIEYR